LNSAALRPASAFGVMPLQSNVARQPQVGRDWKTRRAEEVTMDRTESLVVQVAPAFENQKIAEMEMFGWNLQGRQEIHEAGDAYGAPSFFDSNTYVIKQRVSKYVKLHFARNQGLPNLDAIRQIESEYFNLPFPPPPSQTGPVGCIAICLLLFTCLGCTACILIPTIPEAVRTNRISIIEQLGVVALFVGFIVLPILAGLVLSALWYRSNDNKRKVAMQICEQSARRANELATQVRTLL
jgi:hypothetical protein